MLPPYVPTQGSASIPTAPSQGEMIDQSLPSTIERPQDWCAEKAGRRVLARQQIANGPIPNVAVLPSRIKCRLCGMFIGPSYEEKSVFFFPVHHMNITLENQMYQIEKTILIICGHCAERVPDEDEEVFLQRLKSDPDAKINRRVLPSNHQIIRSDDWVTHLAPRSQAEIETGILAYHTLLKMQMFLLPSLVIALLTYTIAVKQKKEQARQASRKTTKPLPFLGMTPVATLTSEHTHPAQVSPMAQLLWQEQQRFSR